MAGAGGGPHLGALQLGEGVPDLGALQVGARCWAGTRSAVGRGAGRWEGGALLCAGRPSRASGARAFCYWAPPPATCPLTSPAAACPPAAFCCLLPACCLPRVATPCRTVICHGKYRDAALAGIQGGTKEIMITSYGMLRWVGAWCAACAALGSAVANACPQRIAAVAARLVAYRITD